MSITPAFSPGPWITHGACVGSLRRWTFEDLYEQCSFHMAEKMPSSVKLGVRPISARMRSYSSGFSPCAATSSGVIAGSLRIMRIHPNVKLRFFDLNMIKGNAFWYSEASGKLSFHIE